MPWQSVLNNLLITGKNRFLPIGYRFSKKFGFDITSDDNQNWVTKIKGAQKLKQYDICAATTPKMCTLHCITKYQNSKVHWL